MKEPTRREPRTITDPDTGKAYSVPAGGSDDGGEAPANEGTT